MTLILTPPLLTIIGLTIRLHYRDYDQIRGWARCAVAAEDTGTGWTRHRARTEGERAATGAEWECQLRKTHPQLHRHHSAPTRRAAAPVLARRRGVVFRSCARSASSSGAQSGEAPPLLGYTPDRTVTGGPVTDSDFGSRRGAGERARPVAPARRRLE